MRFRIRSTMVVAGLVLAGLWAATALAQSSQSTPPSQNGYMVRIQPLD